MTITSRYNRYHILVADNDPPMGELLYDILTDERYDVTKAASGEAAVEALGKQYYDLVISDLEMRGLSGIDVLKKAKALHPTTRVIILTGNSDIKHAIEAIRNEVDDYILKPFTLHELLERVLHCLEKDSSKPDNRKSAA